MFLIARSAYYFRSGPFWEIRMCVCVYVSNFRDFTEAENACERVLLSHGTLPGKTSALLFGSEKLPSINDLLGLQAQRFGVPKLDHLFGHFFALSLLQNLSFFHAARHLT